MTSNKKKMAKVFSFYKEPDVYAYENYLDELEAYVGRMREALEAMKVALNDMIEYHGLQNLDFRAEAEDTQELLTPFMEEEALPMITLHAEDEDSLYIAEVTFDAPEIYIRLSRTQGDNTWYLDESGTWIKEEYEREISEDPTEQKVLDELYQIEFFTGEKIESRKKWQILVNNREILELFGEVSDFMTLLIDVDAMSIELMAANDKTSGVLIDYKNGYRLKTVGPQGEVVIDTTKDINFVIRQLSWMVDHYFPQETILYPLSFHAVCHVKEDDLQLLLDEEREITKKEKKKLDELMKDIEELVLSQ